jgi:hypothetical protein
MKQLCPICKSEVAFVRKFPYYLCAQCVEKITDREGNSITYEFAQSPFGFKAHYKGDPNKEYIYDICYINGEELKLHTEGKNTWFIQPVNYLKYAGRPEDTIHGQEAQTIPYDPEQRKLRKKQITIEKIIIPAVFVSVLSMVPVVEGLLFLKYIPAPQAKHYLLYIFPSIISLAFCWKIISSRIRKFSRASYFKQHSWAFFFIGIFAAVTVIVLMLNGYKI